MPDPISSRNNDYARSGDFSSDDELTCRDEPLMSRAAPSSGNDGSSAASSEATAADSATTLRSAPGVSGPHAQAHAERDDLYAGAFALKGHDARGVDVEVYSVSAHAGEREAAVQAGMARMGGSLFGGHVAVSGEAFTAQAHATEDNPDGSTGLGASIGSTVIGGEVTVNAWGFSATGGASIGTTVGASVGLRDSDRDGQPEACARVDFGVGSLGVCLEKVW